MDEEVDESLRGHVGEGGHSSRSLGEDLHEIETLIGDEVVVLVELLLESERPVVGREMEVEVEAEVMVVVVVTVMVMMDVAATRAVLQSMMATFAKHARVDLGPHLDLPHDQSWVTT